MERARAQIIEDDELVFDVKWLASQRMITRVQREEPLAIQVFGRQV
jgi:hypothetical protein